MKSLKILVLMHPDLVPPEGVRLTRKMKQLKYYPWETEFDVLTGLRKLGHKAIAFPLFNSLKKLTDELKNNPPDIVFNLLEEFRGDTRLVSNVVRLLEKRKIPYTGCNSKGLHYAKSKALSKELLESCGVKSPVFLVFPKAKKINLSQEINFPVIVKCLYEEASYGISKSSIVHSKSKLRERVKFVHDKLGADAIVEEFIEGREIYVSLIGNSKINVFPVRYLHFGKSKTPLKEIYTQNAKWSVSYRKRQKITTRFIHLNKELIKAVKNTSRIVYSNLNLSGYARLDFRVTSNNEIYFLEANPNPNIALDDDFALSCKKEFGAYKYILEEVLRLGMNKKKMVA